MKQSGTRSGGLITVKNNNNNNTNSFNQIKLNKNIYMFGLILLFDVFFGMQSQAGFKGLRAAFGPQATS